jgi:hypothetical protein
MLNWDIVDAAPVGLPLISSWYLSPLFKAGLELTDTEKLPFP